MGQIKGGSAVRSTGHVRFVATVVIVVTGAIAGIVYCSSGPQQSELDRAGTQTDNPGHDEHASSGGPDSHTFQDEPKHSRPTDPSHDPDPDPGPPGSKLWFVRPDLGEDLHFRSVTVTPLSWDPSCTTHPFYGKSDIETLAKEELSLDPADYFAGTALPIQFAQFWHVGTEYRQFSFRWEQNTPQTFQTEIYGSSDPSMSNDVHPIKIDGIEARSGHLYSAIRDYLKKEVPRMLLDGPVQAGARVGLFRAAARSSKPDGEQAYYLVDLRNAQIVSISGDGLTCAKSETAEAAFCACTTSQRP